MEQRISDRRFGIVLSNLSYLEDAAIRLEVAGKPELLLAEYDGDYMEIVERLANDPDPAVAGVARTCLKIIIEKQESDGYLTPDLLSSPLYLRPV